jgi:ribose 5-phosphate isomerase A
LSEYKKEAARQTISFIKNNKIVGLGAGATIAHVVEILHEIRNELSIKFLTSSFNTLQLLQKYGFEVIPATSVAAIDIYIDGCDQLDKNLNALKSGGGIHAHEKLLATMAKEFIIVGDEGKYVDEFDSRFPVVVDVFPEALNFVLAKLSLLYPGVKILLRLSDKKDGAVITENGNYLIDIWFKEWPELSCLNSTLKSSTGVIETSLFYNLAHKAILSGKDGIRILEKATLFQQNS